MIIYDYSGFSIELPAVAIGPRTGKSKEQRRKTGKEQTGGEGMVQYYPVSHIGYEKYPAKTKAISNEVWTKKTSTCSESKPSGIFAWTYINTKTSQYPTRRHFAQTHPPVCKLTSTDTYYTSYRMNSCRNKFSSNFIHSLNQMFLSGNYVSLISFVNGVISSITLWVKLENEKFHPLMFGVHENELFHPLMINQIRNDYISSINVVDNSNE